MNNLVGQKFLISPNMKNVVVANDMAPPPQKKLAPESAEYIEFLQFMRAEKRQSFWGGIAVAAMAVFTIVMLFLMFNASGMSFMTCQEFGDTFTCRLGGL